MDIYSDIDFEDGYFKNPINNNDLFVSIHSIKTVSNNIARNSLTISNGYSVITLDDLNINIYRENIGWKKITGMRGFGTDPYSPRSTALLIVNSRCYNINIESGHSDCFDNVFSNKNTACACSNSINNRGIINGGESLINTLDYISIINCNTSQVFGQLLYSQKGLCSLSNGINNRGIFAGGGGTDATYSGSCSYAMNINYINISVLSNAFNFGNLGWHHYHGTATSNMTGDKGLIFGTHLVYVDNNVWYYQDIPGGAWWSTSYTFGNVLPISTIEQITISTTSNATFFGSLVYNTSYNSACSNAENNRSVLISGNQYWGPGGNYWNWSNYTSYVRIWFNNYIANQPTSTMEYHSIIGAYSSGTFGNLQSQHYSVSCTSNGIRNRGIEYGYQGSSYNYGTAFSFLHIGGTAEIHGSLQANGTRSCMISNA